MNEPPIDEPPPKPKQQTAANETLKRIENMMERNHNDHMCLLFVLTTVAMVGVVMGLASQSGHALHSSTS